MKVKVLLIVMLLASLGASAVGDALPKPELNIFLPRTIRVTSETLTLGQIAVVFSPNETLGKKASGVAMGRAPWPKEKIVIDRKTILSRLASSGIAAGDVELTGAKAVSVGRNDEVIPREKVLKSAETFLRKDHPCPEGCTWRLTGKVDELLAPAVEGIILNAGLADGATKDVVKVRVSAQKGKQELAGVTISFMLVYIRQQAVATRDIPAGDVLTKDNTKIETVFDERPSRVAWTSPLGMVVTHALPAGAVIRQSLLRPAKLDVIVKRNQTVVIRIEGLCFTITGLGLALQNGRADEYIKVRNIDSKRIIVARVAHDGTVRPVHKEANR